MDKITVKCAGEGDQLFHYLVRNSTFSIVADLSQDKKIVTIDYGMEDKKDSTKCNHYHFDMTLESFHAFLEKCIDHNIYPLINASRYMVACMDYTSENVFCARPELRTVHPTKKDMKLFLSVNHRQHNIPVVIADRTITFINLDGIAKMEHDFHPMPSMKFMDSYTFTYKNKASFCVASKKSEGFKHGSYANLNKPRYLALATERIRAYHEYKNDHFGLFKMAEILNGIFALNTIPNSKSFVESLMLRENYLNARDPRA